eukprot:9398263-Pyramimonas_sp.AAC.1
MWVSSWRPSRADGGLSQSGNGATSQKGNAIRERGGGGGVSTYSAYGGVAHVCYVMDMLGPRCHRGWIR